LECKLAQAASKKRKAVIQLVGDHVGSKQKVVIFTGRKRDVDTLGEELRKKLKGTQVWAAHGGSTPTQRQQVVDDYMEHPGPCVLVGTGARFDSGKVGSADSDRKGPSSSTTSWQRTVWMNTSRTS
jgi:superfamily II DNA helicase RecQ